MYTFQSFYLDDRMIPGRALDLFLPAAAAPSLPALFFVHGGGWTAGSRAHFHPLMAAFIARGYICASADYRLGGVSAADQITDLRHAYALFVEQLRQLGRPPRIAVFGSSAGAHLGLLLAHAAPGECGDSGSAFGLELALPWIPPCGVAVQATPVHFHPWEDIFPPIWQSMQKIAGRPYARNRRLYRRLAPITYARPGVCPVFHLHAENEHMFPLSFLQEHQRRLQRHGVPCQLNIYTRAEHGFLYDITRRQQQEAFADLLDFFAQL